MSPTLETELATALQALCPRAYPDVAPEGTALPYIVWHQMPGSATMYTEGAMANRRNSNVQINVWAATRSACNQLSLAIEAALVAHPQLQVQPLNSLAAAYNEDSTLRGSMQDFSIWGAV